MIDASTEVVQELYDDNYGSCCSSHGSYVVGYHVNRQGENGWTTKITRHCFNNPPCYHEYKFTKRFHMRRYLFTCTMSVVCEENVCFTLCYDATNLLWDYLHIISA